MHAGAGEDAHDPAGPGRLQGPRTQVVVGQGTVGGDVDVEVLAAHVDRGLVEAEPGLGEQRGLEPWDEQVHQLVGQAPAPLVEATLGDLDADRTQEIDCCLGGQEGLLGVEGEPSPWPAVARPPGRARRRGTARAPSHRSISHRSIPHRSIRRSPRGPGARWSSPSPRCRAPGGPREPCPLHPRGRGCCGTSPGGGPRPRRVRGPTREPCLKIPSCDRAWCRWVPASSGTCARDRARTRAEWTRAEWTRWWGSGASRREGGR